MFFYINDFQLRDSKPWKIPAEWRLVEDLAEALPPGASTAPEVTWNEPRREVFARLFDHWSRSLLDGRLEKVVPVVTESGAYDKGAPEFWVAVVKPGRVMFEVAGVSEELAREAMRKAGHKMPMKTRFVRREDQ